jgi:hypothetical protein
LTSFLSIHYIIITYIKVTLVTHDTQSIFTWILMYEYEWVADIPPHRNISGKKSLSLAQNVYSRQNYSFNESCFQGNIRAKEIFVSVR